MRCVAGYEKKAEILSPLEGKQQKKTPEIGCREKIHLALAWERRRNMCRMRTEVPRKEGIQSTKTWKRKRRDQSAAEEAHAGRDGDDVSGGQDSGGKGSRNSDFKMAPVALTQDSAGTSWPGKALCIC